jgi:hypothetical protein
LPWLSHACASGNDANEALAIPFRAIPETFIALGLATFVQHMALATRRWDSNRLEIYGFDSDRSPEGVIGPGR